MLGHDNFGCDTCCCTNLPINSCFFLWFSSINYTCACLISVALFVITINTDFVINIPDKFILHARTQVFRSIRCSKTFDAHNEKYLGMIWWKKSFDAHNEKYLGIIWWKKRRCNVRTSNAGRGRGTIVGRLCKCVLKLHVTANCIQKRGSWIATCQSAGQ
jgi:hypothetical protein